MGVVGGRLSLQERFIVLRPHHLSLGIDEAEALIDSLSHQYKGLLLKVPAFLPDHKAGGILL